MVTPPAILQQWVGEVGRHTGLRVVVYEGLAWHRKQVGGWGGGVGGGRPWGQQGGEGVRAQHQHAVGGLGEVEGGRGARA